MGQASADAIARLLEQSGHMDKLMETEQFWEYRVQQAQELMQTTNTALDVDLSVRIKQDWLNSDRDLDGMRLLFSHYVPEHDVVVGADKRPPRPRQRVLLFNPHRPWDFKQLVYFPQPIKPRTGEAGWATVVAKQNTDFGLEVNPLHANCTQRSFTAVLQETVDRDAALLADVETLDVTIGLDGFDKYCHVLLRLTDYKDGTAVESELKGAGLAVGEGDDHNPNLELIYGAGLGRKINNAIKHGATMQLHRRAVPVNIVGCFDLSAARSVKARRTNASPWSNALVPELIIQADQDASMESIEKLIKARMPLLGDAKGGSDTVEAELSHWAPSFPWSCPRCDYVAL